MVMTESTILPLGTAAPDFKVRCVQTDRMVSLKDFAEAPALLVTFICNHCPFVQHIADGLAAFGKEYTEKGLAIAAINSNDAKNYPEDHPNKMVAELKARGYVFPYLYDESQEAAKAYQAACTPEFYLFDKDRKLAYRGQFDDSRPDNDIPVTGKDLRLACNAVLNGKKPAGAQKPSIGCNIKWKPSNSPAYFGNL